MMTNRYLIAMVCKIKCHCSTSSPDAEAILDSVRAERILEWDFDTTSINPILYHQALGVFPPLTLIGDIFDYDPNITPLSSIEGGKIVTVTAFSDRPALLMMDLPSKGCH